MKKMGKLFVCVLIILMLALPAMADAADRTLAITGTATVSLAADMATLRIGVNTVCDSVGEAQAQNSAIMQQVIDAILKQGVAKEDVITSDFSVYSSTDYSTGTEKVQYTVNNMLNVTIRNLENTAALIDVATEAGANQMYGLSFASSEADKAYEKALTRAYEDATAKAQILAQAAGLELGEVLQLDAANSYGGFYGIRNSYDMVAEASKGAAIVSGDVTVNATVSVVFSLK